MDGPVTCSDSKRIVTPRGNAHPENAQLMLYAIGRSVARQKYSKFPSTVEYVSPSLTGSPTSHSGTPKHDAIRASSNSRKSSSPTSFGSKLSGLYASPPLRTGGTTPRVSADSAHERWIACACSFVSFASAASTAAGMPFSVDSFVPHAGIAAALMTLRAHASSGPTPRTHPGHVWYLMW